MKLLVRLFVVFVVLIISVQSVVNAADRDEAVYWAANMAEGVIVYKLSNPEST